MFVDNCCLGCGSIEFVLDNSPLMEHISKKKSEADIITPIRNNMKVFAYMGKNYFPILDFIDINLIGILEETEVRQKSDS